MRAASLYLGVPAALVMMAVSMGCNWLYLSSFGRTALAIVLLSAASIAIDALKALAPFWLSEAWKRGHIGRGVAAGVVLVLCVGISTASALGFLAETQAASVGGREAVTERYLSAKAYLEDLQTQLAPLAKARAAGVVEAAIAAGQHDARWASSKGCTNDTVNASRTFCGQQELLRLELKASREAERLRGRIVDAVKTVDELKRAGGGQDSDPRGSVIGRFTGFRATDVAYGLELCLAVLVEFAAAFGLFLAVEGAAGGPHPPRGNAAVPVRVIEVVPPRKRKAAGRVGRASTARRIRYSTDEAVKALPGANKDGADRAGEASGMIGSSERRGAAFEAAPHMRRSGEGDI
jgi:hypothetical protein